MLIVDLLDVVLMRIVKLWLQRHPSHASVMQSVMCSVTVVWI